MKVELKSFQKEIKSWFGKARIEHCLKIDLQLAPEERRALEQAGAMDLVLLHLPDRSDLNPNAKANLEAMGQGGLSVTVKDFIDGRISQQCRPTLQEANDVYDLVKEACLKLKSHIEAVGQGPRSETLDL